LIVVIDFTKMRQF